MAARPRRPNGSARRYVCRQVRDRLFPETPVLYVGTDPRNLPPGALDRNASAVGQALDIPGVFEDILQVRPATKHIVIVVGATPLKHGRRKVGFPKGSRVIRRADRLQLLQRSFL